MVRKIDNALVALLVSLWGYEVVVLSTRKWLPWPLPSVTAACKKSRRTEAALLGLIILHFHWKVREIEQEVVKVVTR